MRTTVSPLKNLAFNLIPHTKMDCKIGQGHSRVRIYLCFLFILLASLFLVHTARQMPSSLEKS